MENRITGKEYEALLEMAKKTCLAVRLRGDLEKRSSDSDDFLDLAVWGLKEMLIEAYEMGKNARK